MRSRWPRWAALRRAEGAAAPLARELDAAIDRHVLDAWLPRSIDREHGGFRCDFDGAWRATGPDEKLLEFQARQTRVAALACRRRPPDAAARAWCRHGVAALAGPLRDAERGGLFALCARDGRPLRDGDKHAHGIAYAIHALVEASVALDDPAPLALARETFAWYDAHAWDREHGGYWGWLRPDGVPYGLDPGSAPAPVDPLGTPVAGKDTNVNGDTLEALCALAERSGDELARERVAELLALFERLIRESHGVLPARLDRALRPLGDEASPGNAFQASWRLPAARRLITGTPGAGALERSLRARAAGHRGPTGGIVEPSGAEEWWTQLERLRAAAVAFELDPDAAAAARAEAAETWAYLRREFADEGAGGFGKLPASTDPRRIKGTRWKDGSHDAFALAAAARAFADG